MIYSAILINRCYWYSKRNKFWKYYGNQVFFVRYSQFRAFPILSMLFSFLYAGNVYYHRKTKYSFQGFKKFLVKCLWNSMGMKKIFIKNTIISFLIKRILHRFKRYYKGDTSERLKCSAFANENQNEKSKKITDKHNFVLKIFILFFCKSIEFLSTIRSHVWPLPLWDIFGRIVHFYGPAIFEIWKKYERIIVGMRHCPFQLPELF